MWMDGQTERLTEVMNEQDDTQTKYGQRQADSSSTFREAAKLTNCNLTVSREQSLFVSCVVGFCQRSRIPQYAVRLGPALPCRLAGNNNPAFLCNDLETPQTATHGYTDISTAAPGEQLTFQVAKY